MRIMKSVVTGLVISAALGSPLDAAALAGQKGHVALFDAQIKTDVEHKLSELELASARVDCIRPRRRGDVIRNRPESLDERGSDRARAEG
jgi:hypothetical protein